MLRRLPSWRSVAAVTLLLAHSAGQVNAEERGEELPSPEALTKALASPDRKIRRQAITAVVNFATLPMSYRPAFDEAMGDCDEIVNHCGAIGMAATGDRGPFVVQSLLDALKHEIPSYRVGPAEYVQWGLVKQGAASVPILIAALKREETRGHHALRALQSIGRDAKDALPTLRELLRKPPEALHSALLFTKWRIDGDYPFAIAGLTSLLETKRERQCGGAVDYLRQCPADNFRPVSDLR